MCARCSELEVENQELRWALGVADQEANTWTIRRTLGLEPTASRILLRLYAANGRTVERGALEELLRFAQDPRPNNISVHVSRARKRLGAGSIVTDFGVGYAMSAAGIVAMRDVLQPRKAA